MRRNPHFIAGVKEQLLANDCTLAECYCFRAAPSILLVVAWKGTAAADRVIVRDRPEITSFHGRYDFDEYKKYVVKVYAHDQGMIPMRHSVAHRFVWHAESIPTIKAVFRAGKALLPPGMKRYLRGIKRY